MHLFNHDICNTYSSALAGGVASAVTNPLDLAKLRLQVSKYIYVDVYLYINQWIHLDNFKNMCDESNFFLSILYICVFVHTSIYIQIFTEVYVMRMIIYI
jgi:hypothetical protein